MKFLNFSFWGDKFGLPGSGPDQDFQSGSGFTDSIESGSGSEALVEALVVGSIWLFVCSCCRKLGEKCPRMLGVVLFCARMTVELNFFVNTTGFFSVADPDPSDPFVFGPPGSGSDSRSFYHQTK
jgi:hypothetical protein